LPRGFTKLAPRETTRFSGSRSTRLPSPWTVEGQGFADRVGGRSGDLHPGQAFTAASSARPRPIAVGRSGKTQYVDAHPGGNTRKPKSMIVSTNHALPSTHRGRNRAPVQEHGLRPSTSRGFFFALTTLGVGFPSLSGHRPLLGSRAGRGPDAPNQQPAVQSGKRTVMAPRFSRFRTGLEARQREPRTGGAFLVLQSRVFDCTQVHPARRRRHPKRRRSGTAAPPGGTGREPVAPDPRRCRSPTPSPAVTRRPKLGRRPPCPDYRSTNTPTSNRPGRAGPQVEAHHGKISGQQTIKARPAFRHRDLALIPVPGCEVARLHNHPSRRPTIPGDGSIPRAALRDH